MQLRGGMGSIYQEPYRSEAFKLFSKAYNHGFITNISLVADTMKEAIKEN